MEYGKFNSAEELLKGYNELEKSFTQKCQQLAELKNSLSQAEESSNPTTTSSGTNEASSPLTTEQATDLTGGGNGSAVRTVAQSVTNESKDSAAEENVCAVPADNDALSAANDGPSSQLSPIEQIRQYLAAHPDERDSLLNGSSGQAQTPLPKVMASGGNVSLCLPTKPKTIKEASVLAKKLFEN